MKGVCVWCIFGVVSEDSEADREVDRESEQSNLQTAKSFVDFDLSSSSNPKE